MSRGEERTSSPRMCKTSDTATGYPLTCVWLSNFSNWCAWYGREVNLSEGNPPEWCDRVKREAK